MTKPFKPDEEKIVKDIMAAITQRILKGSYQGGLGAKDFTGVVYYMFKKESDTELVKKKEEEEW